MIIGMWDTFVINKINKNINLICADFFSGICDTFQNIRGNIVYSTLRPGSPFHRHFCVVVAKCVFFFIK